MATSLAGRSTFVDLGRTQLTLTRNPSMPSLATLVVDQEGHKGSTSLGIPVVPHDLRALAAMFTSVAEAIEGERVAK